MLQYSIQLRTKKYVKECGSLSVTRKYKKQQQLLNTGLYAVKCTFKKTCP